ncbi:MAG TPA: hypothetical protein VI757_07835 [Bacteroidia bacterium]|nr:hypothetical protein [Bacteroidia bacterium]
MARIKFPNTFAGVVKLFRDFKKKYDAEAGASKAQPYLDEHAIDPAADALVVDDAEEANKNFDEKEKLAEEKSEKRDDLFDPRFAEHEGEVQHLKKLFRGNVTKLGQWSVQVDARGRVIYPPDFSARASGVLLFIDKHDSFPPGTSPLQPYLNENDVDIAASEVDVNSAITVHDEFKTAERDREEFRAERDGLMAPIEEHLRGIGQYFIGLFPKNPKKAGQWGYEVDDSPQADKTRDGVIKFSSIKTLQQLALGTEIINTGSIPWKLFRGKTATGVPVVMNPGGKFIIVRGYGTSTLQNEHPSQDGAYQATFNK